MTGDERAGVGARGSPGHRRGSRESVITETHWAESAKREAGGESRTRSSKHEGP